MSSSTREEFEVLYRQHSDFVTRVVRRILSSSDAEDVVQDTFVAAFQGIDGLSDKAALRGWLRTIAVRSSMKVIRRRYSRLEEPWSCALLEEPRTDSVQEAFAQELKVALQELPADMRQLWVSMRIEGFTFVNIAKKFSVSQSTVKRRIREADERLGRRVTPFTPQSSARLAH